jgi:hypothetical protein
MAHEFDTLGSMHRDTLRALAAASRARVVRPGTAAGLLALATGVVVLVAAVGVRHRQAPPATLNIACADGSVWQDVSVRRDGATYVLARSGAVVATVSLNACSLLKEAQKPRP